MSEILLFNLLSCIDINTFFVFYIFYLRMSAIQFGEM